MKAVSIHDAKTNLSKYIAAAKRGETIYIGSHGKPEVSLTIHHSSVRPKRKLGPLAHQSLTIPRPAQYQKDWQETIDTMLHGPISHE